MPATWGMKLKKAIRHDALAYCPMSLPVSSKVFSLADASSHALNLASAYVLLLRKLAPAGYGRQYLRITLLCSALIEVKILCALNEFGP